MDTLNLYSRGLLCSRPLLDDPLRLPAGLVMVRSLWIVVCRRQGEPKWDWSWRMSALPDWQKLGWFLLPMTMVGRLLK